MDDKKKENKSKPETKKSFTSLVSMYGLRRDIAAAVRSQCPMDSSGKVTEDKFVKTIKTVTSKVVR